MNLNTTYADEQIVKEVMFDSRSAVAKAFRMSRDCCAINKKNNVTLKLRKSSSHRDNITASEVAALVVGDFGKTGTSRDVLIKHSSGGLQRISEIHPLYMALQYPLLFPYGKDGFHPNILYHVNTGKRKTQRDNVTMKEFYCYRIQQHLNEGTTLLKGDKLFYQYLTDAYSAVEEQRLSWVRFNQDELRAELYNNIFDTVTRGDTDTKKIGKMIVLPTTFTGSPRHMAQNYQDAMTIYRSFGNPTLFIKITTNPRWLEVTEMLASFPRQRAHHRPDIMARVFRLKLTQLMNELRKEEIFGKIEAAVVDHMLHGPCGRDTKKPPCMVNGECIKHFTKPFYNETTVDEDAFPIYKRRNNGLISKKGKTNLDNRHIVQYIIYLPLKYNGHINVEWCNQSRPIKYLFKYISKGPDKATTLLLRRSYLEDESGDI
ncbi:LOW QUALITY PROTEIN: hypothetical protein V2J09_016402 [Rumex salicifolius]